MGIESFLDALLTAETGLEASRADWYAANLDRRVLRYWAVRWPGELERDPATGDPRLEAVTVAEYFQRLGVAWLCDRVRPETVAAARYSVINGWGFIGFQMGEALLIETGHYLPNVVDRRRPSGRSLPTPSFYSGDVPNLAWAGGVTSTSHRPYGGPQEIVATHVNQWQGAFTGLDGADSLEAFRTQAVQERVFRSVLRHNYRRILQLAAAAGFDLNRRLDEISRRDGAAYTISGCLAAAHLCGPAGLYRYLATESEAWDETGTRFSSYLARFSGFAVEAWLAFEGIELTHGS
ncbi:MAG: hypothetical protein ING71_07535 [Rhodocyclaceae bacterium]|nr:hypothetical protein [Rhodocyclaceae bacterium]